MCRCCWQEGQVPGSRIREHGEVDIVPGQTPLLPLPHTNARCSCSWIHAARRGMDPVYSTEPQFSYLISFCLSLYFKVRKCAEGHVWARL